MRMRSVLYKIACFSLLLFFAFALFYHLGRFSFWQDEAETALLAKSILKFGLPLSHWDGIWVTHFHGQESRVDHLWTHTPWLPFYLTALSFKLFGFHEWAGRLPFALAGFLSAIVLFLAVKGLKNKTTTLLTLFFYVTSVTVIIYSRQCKYYPVYLLGFTLVILGFFRWEEKRKGLLCGLLGFLICFHCNYLSAGLALLALGFYRPSFFLKIAP